MSLFYQILTALFILFITWVLRSYHKALKWKGNMKGPTIYPLLLNDYLFFSGRDRGTILNELFQKYGETTYIYSNLFAQIATINPDNIQHFISGQHNFTNYKRESLAAKNISFVKLARVLFGDGIFAADDEIWEIQRIHANPLFKKSCIVEMIPTFVKKGKIVLQLLKETNLENSVDLQNLYMRYTLDSFGEIGFGISFDVLKTEQEFPSWFDKAQRMIMDLSLNPIRRLIRTNEYLKLVQNIDKVVYDIIDKKVNPEKQNDLISKFMCLRDADGKPFPKKWIRDIVMNFLIAGRDTTATLLTWTSYLLAKNPKVMEKALEEVKMLNGEEPNNENIKKLKYIDYILKESMRVHTPVPGVARFALNSDVLPDKTVVSAGTRIKYWTYFLHRSPKYWDDPLEFKPERWEDQKSLIRHSYQYLPFHGGPMSCIGRKMAELEAKTLLILILQNYKFELNEKHKYMPFLGIITNCEGGCPLFLRPT